MAAEPGADETAAPGRRLVHDRMPIGRDGVEPRVASPALAQLHRWVTAHKTLGDIQDEVRVDVFVVVVGVDHGLALRGIDRAHQRELASLGAEVDAVNEIDHHRMRSFVAARATKDGDLHSARVDGDLDPGHPGDVSAPRPGTIQDDRRVEFLRRRVHPDDFVPPPL